MLHFFLFYLTQPTVLKYIYRNSYVCAKKKEAISSFPNYRFFLYYSAHFFKNYSYFCPPRPLMIHGAGCCLNELRLDKVDTAI